MTAPLLPTPLRDTLREPFDDGDVARLWPAIEARRARGAARWTALALPLAAAAATTLALAHPHATHGDTHAPLHMASGAPIALAASTGTLRLDDRSSIELRADASLTVRRNDGVVFETALGGGAARFDVTPRGPRRWSVDCGLATVTVLGTSFVLERSPERLHVAVLHGLVRVAGARVRGGAVVLTEGQTLDVTATDAPRPVAAPVTPVAPPPPVDNARARMLARTPHPAPEPWRELASRREFDAAWAALGPSGTSTRAARADADELLALGEVAHRSRHFDDAAGLYARFVTEHPAHAQAAMVAFTLGRIRLDQLHDARAAADSFGDALRLGLPRDLQEDALARRVEALARAHDDAGAHGAAAEYLQRFPSGRRVDDVHRWAP